MKRLLKKNDGYILTWMLVFFLMVSLLSVTAITFSLHATQTTSIQHNVRQAQFTARSAVNAMADYIKDNPEKLDGLVGNTGTGSGEGMGTYEVEVEKTAGIIKLTAIANYKGQNARTSAYLRPVAGGSSDFMIPTDNVFHVDKPVDGIADFGQSKITGNVFVNGGFYLANSSMLEGSVAANGDVHMSGDATSTTDVFSFGNVVYTASGKLQGNLYTKGDLEVSGGGHIGGNVYVDGDLDLTKGSGRILGDAYIGGTASFAGGGNRAMQDLYYYGNYPIFSSDRFLHQFMPNGDAIKMSGTYLPISTSGYEPPDLPPIEPPSQSDMPDLYNTVAITDRVISGNGVLNAAAVAEMKKQLEQINIWYGGVITIDARDNDVHLLVNENLFINASIDLEIIASEGHNVFIYLTGDSSISTDSNQYIGMKEKSAPPQLYIFGDGTGLQAINITGGNSSLNACVYMPHGSVTGNGSRAPNTDYKLQGIYIVGQANISADNIFKYSPPPGVDDIILGQLGWSSWGSSSSSTWEIGRWGE